MNITPKKEDIIQASIELFVSEGADNTTMDHIAEKAKVSKRTLYKYFNSKKALINEIVIYLIDKRHSGIDLNFPRHSTLSEQLMTICEQKTSFMVQPENIKLGKIIYSEFLKDEGDLQFSVDTILEVEKTYLNWAKESVESGLIKVQMTPLEIMELLNELISGIIFMPIVFGRKKGVSQSDLENIVTMLTAVLTAN